jgi:uncharacterized protein YciI
MLREGPTESEGRIISEHFSYLKRLMGEGVVILAGRTQNTDDTSFGIVIFNAQSDREARQVLHDDPAVKAQVFHGELFPYMIALIQERNV